MDNLSYLSFRKMELEDVFTFKNWARHDSILFLDYNFIEESEKEVVDWFNWKTKKPMSEYYVALFKDKIIG